MATAFYPIYLCRNASYHFENDLKSARLLDVSMGISTRLQRHNPDVSGNFQPSKVAEHLHIVTKSSAKTARSAP